MFVGHDCEPCKNGRTCRGALEFGWLTRVGTWHHVSDRSLDPPQEGALTLGDTGMPAVDKLSVIRKWQQRLRPLASTVATCHTVATVYNLNDPLYGSSQSQKHSTVKSQTQISVIQSQNQQQPIAPIQQLFHHSSQPECSPLCALMLRLSAAKAVEVNRFGRLFTSGCPLPRHMRVEIVRLSTLGLRLTAISRRLAVSHACVSKILTRCATYRRCIGGSRIF